MSLPQTASDNKTLTFQCDIVGDICYLLLRPKEIIVWLSSTTFFWVVVGGRIFFFFFFKIFFFPQIKVKATQNYLTSVSPNTGANKSTVPKDLCIQVLNQYQNVDRLTTTTLKIFLKDQNSQRKKKNFGILKIRCGILLHSKNFFPVFKN